MRRDREKIQEKFRRENVRGNFLPARKLRHGICLCKTGKGNGLPVLLWGPRDERPDENGVASPRQPVRPVRNRKSAAPFWRSVHLHDKLPPDRSGI